MAIRVFLADDHTLVRDGLRAILQAHSDITVVGEAANGLDTVHQVQQLSPDVVLMDIAMPELNGIEATAQIHWSNPSVRVIILSVYLTSEHTFRALRAGARGYVLKESAGAEVVEAIRAVYAGKRYLCQSVADALVSDYLSKSQAEPVFSPLESLSEREREILQWVVEGKSQTAIGEMLHLSPKTVETYYRRMMRKLGIKDLPSLVKFAIQHGLTPLE